MEFSTFLGTAPIHFDLTIWSGNNIRIYLLKNIVIHLAEVNINQTAYSPRKCRCMYHKTSAQFMSRFFTGSFSSDILLSQTKLHFLFDDKEKPNNRQPAADDWSSLFLNCQKFLSLVTTFRVDSEWHAIQNGRVYASGSELPRSRWTISRYWAAIRKNLETMHIDRSNQITEQPSVEIYLAAVPVKRNARSEGPRRTT